MSVKLTTRGRVVITMLVVAVASFATIRMVDSMGKTSAAAPRDVGVPDPGSQKFVPTKAYLKDACELPPEWVRYIHRGWDPLPIRNSDLVLVPQERGYIGSPADTPHSGPYDYLQEVPLVWYGPAFIRQTGAIELEGEPTVADIAPTQARILHFDGWPERDGRALDEVLKETSDEPKLIVTISIDGGGWNVLDRWPDDWPFLKQLMNEGASVTNAVVGSSPSITPAIHTNMSTGAFPRTHGVTGIGVRQASGRIVGGYSLDPDSGGAAREADPTVNLKVTSIGDEWDLANDNESLVGMVAAGNFVAGFVGAGSAIEGADKDLAAFHATDGWATNPKFYESPEYLNTDVEGPEADIEELDLLDGEDDDQWRGHGIKVEASPAFAPWQVRTAIEMLEREGFGKDDLADLFYLHLKSPDVAGHEYNMISPEQGDVLASVDQAIEDLIDFLNDHVGPDGYAVVITADHGQTPTDRGGWPINRAELYKDVEERFGEGVIERTSSTSIYLDRAVIDASGIKPEKVASFLSRYRIGDNIPPGGAPPEGATPPPEDGLDDRTFAAVFPGGSLPDIVSCTGALE